MSNKNVPPRPELDIKNVNNSKKPKQPNTRRNLMYLLIAVALAAFMSSSFGNPFANGGSVDTLSTNVFRVAVEEENVSSVKYRPADGTIVGKWWQNGKGKPNSKELHQFKSTYVGDDSLSELMAEHPDIKYVVDTSDSDMVRDLIVYVLPTVLLIGVMVTMVKKIGGQNSQAMSFGKIKAKMNPNERPDVKFKDVAGIDEAVEELEEVKDFLKNPERYLKMGAKIPRGVLLVGPPGTGKTLLAKAVAGEAEVPFFTISGSEFLEMFVGVGASRVRDLFKQAKKASPSIIFIDEIDAVGRQRGAGLGGGHDEREQTLNQLLVEMDGFADNEAVILIAATNRPDILDPALLRPGRFDRQITVGRPDVKGREQILKVHSKNKPLDKDIQFEKLAQLTPGFTGADLANLMNESALLAAREHKTEITMSEVEEAMERIIAGPKRKSRVMTETERKTIAYHESGHALVGHILENSDPVHKISIISRGQALGYTLQLPEEDHFLETREGMLDEIAVLLGGRTAEELFCEDITTGASNDLERATKIARNMVTRFGMSEELGTQVFGEAQHEVFLGRDYADKQDFSDETAKRIDVEVQRIMREAHIKAHDILEAHADQMHQMAHVLLVRETVEGEAVDALLDNKWNEYLETHPQEAEAMADAEAGEVVPAAGDVAEHEALEEAEKDE